MNNSSTFWSFSSQSPGEAAPQGRARTNPAIMETSESSESGKSLNLINVSAKIGNNGREGRSLTGTGFSGYPRIRSETSEPQETNLHYRGR